MKIKINYGEEKNRYFMFDFVIALCKQSSQRNCLYTKYQHSMTTYPNFPPLAFCSAYIGMPKYFITIHIIFWQTTLTSFKYLGGIRIPFLKGYIKLW